MLEELLIFTRGGLILWSSCRALGGAALRGSPIDALIRSCLLEERSADATFSHDNYALKWAFHNDLGLVFVAVYHRMLRLLYVDDLLAAARREFSRLYDPGRTSYDHDFTDVFRQLHLEAQARAEEMNKSKQALPPASASSHKARRGGGGGGDSDSRDKKGASSGKDDSDGDDNHHHALANGGATFNGHQGATADPAPAPAPALVKGGKENGGPKDNGAFDVSKLQKLRRNDRKNPAADNAAKKLLTKPDTKKKGKQARVWDDKPSNKKLDFTDPADERGDEVTQHVLVKQGESMMDKDDNLSSDSEEEEVEDGPKKKGWFSSMFQR
jgi:signal recognition particle receptor subunit alpha